MRVLLVNDYGTPTGGAENMCLMLRDELRRRGHEARFFASTARPLDVDVLADDTCLGTTSRFRTLLQSANPWAAQRLRAVIQDFRPDVVHVRIFLTQLSPLILPVLRNVPSVLHIADYRPICPVSSKQRPDGSACHTPPGAVCLRAGCLPLRDWLPLQGQMALWDRWRDAFDLVVANSDWVRRRLRAEGLDVGRRIWNGVPVRPARPPLADPPTVAFAGRLVPNKGVDVLLRAVARVAERVPDVRLLVAGDGPERDRLRAQAAALGVAARVEWLGHLSRERVEERFASAWAQAAPSNWEEPFGLVAAEGMMRGSAVVASRIGGLSEIVDEGRTGLLVPPGDADALANALLDILSDRERAEAMGRLGRERALTHFSERSVVDQFLEVYEELRRPTPEPASLAPVTS